MELTNISILKYQDIVDAQGNVIILRKALEEMDVQSFHGLPIYFVRGAMKIPIGFIHVARRGRDEVFADIILEIDGSLDLTKDEKDKIRSVSFSFKKKAP